MATRTVVKTLCDMPHEGEVEGATVTIVVDRLTTEVDLCDDCLTERVGPLVREGRTVRGKRGKLRVV